MQHSRSVQEIQTLIQSFHPILVIETVEEERVQSLLQAATIKPTTIGNTAESLAVLQHIESMSLKAAFWLKDFAQDLDDPAIVRQLRELAQKFSLNRSAIILTGRTVVLPQEIAHDAVYMAIDSKNPASITDRLSSITFRFTRR